LVGVAYLVIYLKRQGLLLLLLLLLLLTTTTTTIAATTTTTTTITTTYYISQDGGLFSKVTYDGQVIDEVRDGYKVLHENAQSLYAISQYCTASGDHEVSRKCLGGVP